VGESKERWQSIIIKKVACCKVPQDGMLQHYSLFEYDAMLFGNQHFRKTAVSIFYPEDGERIFF
jgi:hypothetical protein